MKKLIYVTMLVLFTAILYVPSASARLGSGASVDVIVLTEGPTDPLKTHIQSLGGTVKYQYRNVTALAASIPADKMGAIAAFTGVMNVEKDRMVYLDDDPKDQYPMSLVVEEMTDVTVQALDMVAMDPGNVPEGYTNVLYTGAQDVWDITSRGFGTIVAVVDTGTVPNLCLKNSVIGAPGYPDGYNASGDGIPATDPLNHWHGTIVGGVIASNCALGFSSSNMPLYQAIDEYLPGWEPNFVPIYGQAPWAELYPVKVFRADGSGVPISVILDGLDHVLTLKKTNLLDIDIVNMSLSGSTLWDGRGAYDRFIEKLVEADIMVVTSAGNSGPVPNTIGAPATSFGAVSVGALDYAPSSRVLYEYLGLVNGFGPGQGMVMRPTAEIRVANYSSRGPLSDGRFGPEIMALGHWNFHLGPGNEYRWAAGTSFAAPTVAGGAALLNAWWEAQGNETDPTILENVLLLGANPCAVGPTWQGVNDQGYGTLDISASLDLLMAGDWKLTPAKKEGALTANVLGKPVKGKIESWESDFVTLQPSEPFNAVFEISEWTSKVVIEVYDLNAENNSDRAYSPNALEVHVQSAKRTSFDHPVERYWYPYAYGNTFQIEIKDGSWTSPFGEESNQPMEPGLMKLSLIGPYWNEASVRFKVNITRENFRELLDKKYRIANGIIKMASSEWIPVDIPKGVSTAIFDLVWVKDWRKFPTSDLDMIIYSPDFERSSIDGATGNAPERATISAPDSGTWWVLIDGYEVNKSDNYELYLTME